MGKDSILLPSIAALLLASACDIDSTERDLTPRAYGTAVQAPGFSGYLDTVDVTASGDDAVVTAYDEHGAPIGSLAMWVDDAGVAWFASDYADGHALVGVDQATGAIVGEESTLPADIIAERAELIVETIELDPQEKGEWFWCATLVGTTVGICAGAAASGGLLLVGCAASSAAATCKCITAWASNKGKDKCAE